MAIEKNRICQDTHVLLCFFIPYFATVAVLTSEAFACRKQDS